MATRDKRLKWFREARFGMFIHWGVYSLIRRGTWVRNRERIPAEEYARYARRFKARRYKPQEWVKLAKDAGMKYMVLTSKHHDGYCLFDTKTTDFNSVKIGPHRDLVAEYVNACRKHDMGVGLYYSLPDWSRPAFFKGPDRDPAGWREFLSYIRAQIEEICTQYGRLDILWYDNILHQSGKRPLTAEDYESRKLNRMVRKHQPDVLINDRSLLPEDFYTAEQHPTPPKDRTRAWETCMTIGNFWSYVPSDTIRKSSRQLVHTLTGIVSNDGNFLLNVGPKADGTVPAPCRKILRETGAWVKKHGECIYGAGRCTLDPATAGVSIEKDGKVYLVVHWWPGRTLYLPRVPYEISSAHILSTGQQLGFERKGARLILRDLPPKAPDALSTVIVLKKAK